MQTDNKSSVDHLREVLNELNVSHIHGVIKYLKWIEKDRSDSDSIIHKLQKKVRVTSSFSDDEVVNPYKVIDTGIDNLEYNYPSNLSLQELMDSFTRRIQKDGVRTIINLLDSDLAITK